MTIVWGLLLVILVLLMVVWNLRPQDRVENRRKNRMVCKRPPKGWICVNTPNHEGECEARPLIEPMHFLRRNSKGKLERLVTNGEWTGWINAERPARYWYIWAAIARARGI